MDEANPQVASHVASCAQCQKVLEGYRQVDSLSRRCFRPKVRLTEQIQAACAHEAERMAADQLLQELSPKKASSSTGSRSFGWRRIWYVAAALVIVAMLSALTTANYMNRYSVPQSTEASAPMLALRNIEPGTPHALASAQPSVQPANMPSVPPLQAELPEQPAATDRGGFSLADSRCLQLKRISRHGDMNEMTMVSSEGRPMRMSPGLHQPIRLPSEIEQVWIANGNLASEEFIRQVQKTHPDLVEEVSGPDDLGILTVRFHTDDMGVQYMVDTLFQQGKWTLLSANYPQPGCADEVAFHEQPTNYTLKILTNQ